MNAMPLSANGKLDRRALPKPPARGAVQIDNNQPLSADEQRLADWWKELLSVEHVGRNDDFFTLGGHSIHAIQLMVRLRRKGIWVEINTLYAHSTLASQALAIRNYTEAQKHAPDEVVNPVQKLIAQLNHAPEAFRLLQPLNSSAAKERVWMVHPSVVGSDIYRDLAQALSDRLSVIGINNYNLYHQPQIASLEGLASHYLQEMMASGLTPDQPVRLLGWSLGGNIALEIASQLEGHGYRHIHVCLLDTVYQTEFQFSAQVGTLGSILQMIGIEEDAAQRALMAEQTDILLGQQPVSTPLQHTRITLFKAMQFATPGEYESEEGQKMLSMADNGLAALGIPLQLMPMEANHFSIIHCHHEIGAALLSTTHSSESADVPEVTRMKRRA
ncbi:thioesterase domain-containing protein [Erwinia sp. V71]|uniref:thioesterase domain-containing protein n=1 Tax=Erwinia sp. V71 TaxID=3369424 RepID=UPI003F5F45D3